MLRDLPARKHLCENVHGHVVGGAVLQLNESTLYHIANEMVADVNVFRACMIVIVLSELEHSLVVTVEHHWFWLG